MSNAYGFESSRDLNQVSLEVLDVQVLFLDDTPGYYPDNADLIKVTVQVTNNEPSYFSVQDRMFRILVYETDPLRSTADNEVLELVDNYYTTYDDRLEINYDNLHTREIYEECDIVNKVVHYETPQIFTVCYEVLRSWSNSSVNLDGPRKYYLVMSDVSQGLSCHRTCYKIFLSNYDNSGGINQELKIPKWIQNLFDWHYKGIISEEEFQNSINYLQQKDILPDAMPENIDLPDNFSFEAKNQKLKEHHTRITTAAQSSNLYVSKMNFYEPMYFDDFSGVLCKQQNNIVTLSGDYTNEDAFFDAIFFKLLLFDSMGRVVDTGLSKIVDVVPGEFRHFEVSTPYTEKIDHCMVIVDSKFQN